MKTLFLIALLFVAGCIPTTQQVQTLTNDVDALMVSIDNYQEKFAEEVDRVQEHIVVVNEAIKEKADESVVKQLIAANQALAPVNPYAPIIDAGLKILLAISAPTAIGGIALAKHNSNKTKNVTAKYQAHKQGAEKFRVENPDKGADLYNDIGEARVRNKVT